MVNLALRRRRQPDHVSVEVLQNTLEAVVHGAVSLVDDDEVEGERPELCWLVTVVPNEIHHRVVGGDIHITHLLRILDEVHGCGLRVHAHKSLVRLVDQGSAVRQKQHLAHPAGLAQQLSGGHGHTSLTGSCRHDQQCLATPPCLQRLRHRADGLKLIRAGAASNVCVYRRFAQQGAHGAPTNHAAQLLRSGEALYLAGGIARTRTRKVGRIIDEVDVITISAQHDGSCSILALDAIRVQLHLVGAHAHGLHGLLRLDDGQRCAVIIPQDVVRITDTGRVRHAVQLKLPSDGVTTKTGHVQHGVDELSAGLGLTNRQWRVRLCSRPGALSRGRFLLG